MDTAKTIINIIPAPLQVDSTRATRSSYLPRALKNPYTHHFILGQLCRSFARLLAKAACSEIKLLQIYTHAKTKEFYNAIPETHPIPNSGRLITSVLLPTIIDFEKHHKRAMKALLKIQRMIHKNAATKYLRQLYYKCKSKAHTIVFSAGYNNTGTHSMDITAIQHPLHEIVVDQSSILEGLAFSQRKLNAQSVPAHLASSPPYQEHTGEVTSTQRPPLLDPIIIAKCGTEVSLASHLTIELFDTCLKSLKINKAAGVDMWPNELLKHIPIEHRSMLFAIY